MKAMFWRGRVFFAVFIVSNRLRGGLGVDFVYMCPYFYSFYAVADTFQNNPCIEKVSRYNFLKSISIGYYLKSIFEYTDN